MGYWEDQELMASAHAACLIEIFEEMIDNAEDDEPVKMFHHIIGVCRSVVALYEPEGEPVKGYPSAKVLNLEREKAKRRLS